MLDNVFGELEYEYGWNGSVCVDWFGEQHKVDLVVMGEEDEDFSPWQYESFTGFVASWSKIKDQLLKKIFEYYLNLRSELGYDDNSSEDYPEVSDAEELKGMITLDAVVIPLPGIYDRRCAALAFHCDWDPENGLGVSLLDEAVDEIGYQDIVF